MAVFPPPGLNGVPGVAGMPMPPGPMPGRPGPPPAAGPSADAQAALADLQRTIIADYGPLVRQIQSRRKLIEQAWLDNLDCYKGIHRRQGFTGEWFNHYLPHARRNLERFVTRGRQMLFPSPEFFEVYPLSAATSDLAAFAEAWKVYLLWLVTRQINLRGITAQVLRSILLYQRGIVKAWPRVQPGPQGPEVWPACRAVDPFAFYVWPETSACLDDATVLMETALMPWAEYAAQQRAGQAGPEALGQWVQQSELTRPEWPDYLIQRLAHSGLSAPTDAVGGGTGPTPDPGAHVQLTELWIASGATRVQVWLVWNVPEAPRIARFNVRFPTPPYRMALTRVVPGEHYAPSLMSDLAPLNAILNDQLNMTLEAQAVALAPPTAVNPDLIARSDSLVFRPRAKWYIDPAGVSSLNIKPDVSAGQAGLAFSAQMLDSFSGLGALSDGPTRGLPRAGFAVGQLINLSMADIRDYAETIEDEILTPVLADFARLTMLAVPPQQMLRIPGAEALGLPQFRAAYLQAGDAAFRWVGTLQAQDLQVRAQRLLSFLGQFGRLYPVMQQQGWDVDMAGLMKYIWREGIGERGAETLIVRRAQPPVMPGPPGPPGAPAAPGQPGVPVGAQAPAPGSQEAADRQIGRQQQETVGMTGGGTAA